MKCEDCLSLLEEYGDAELHDRDALRVKAHLALCLTCDEAYAALQQEQQLYAHYQRDLEVTAALWQGVQASLKREAAQPDFEQPAGMAQRLRRFFGETFHAPRFSLALAALLVVIAVGATVLVMKVVNQNSNPAMQASGNIHTTSSASSPHRNTAPSSEDKALAGGTGNSNEPPNSAPEQKNNAVNPPDKNHYAVKQDAPQMIPIRNESTPRQTPLAKVAASKPRSTAEELVRDAEQKYVQAIALLQRDFDQRRSKLDPKLVAKLDASLASIDRTIAETRKAVHQNSDDPIALQYLLTAYAKKVEVLKDVTAN
ncbi:MAG: hypothetical protein HY231_22535 [Acidobacteria bacterium]|nr:hypothetical protein [Acidobacteriota bacterium]